MLSIPEIIALRTGSERLFASIFVSATLILTKVVAVLRGRNAEGPRFGVLHCLDCADEVEQDPLIWPLSTIVFGYPGPLAAKEHSLWRISEFSLPHTPVMHEAQDGGVR